MASKRLASMLRRPYLLLCVLWLILMMLAALLPSVLWGGDAFALNMAERLRPPSSSHPFGTDEYGRDLLARVLLGTRYSLGAAVGVVLVSAVIGTVVGTLSAWFGGIVDLVVMRIVELFMSFPALILAIAIVSALGASLFNAVLALLVIWWGQYARLIRSEVLRIKNEQYVEGASALGASIARLLCRHVIPNAVFPVAVKATIDVGVAILLIGGLSFIGLAAQAPLPEWGLLISSGRQYLLSYWWYAVMPGTVMFLTVVSTNVLGDQLLTQLDPRLRH